MEICVEGFWGTVCDSGFGREEAMVVCKQLGIKTLGIYIPFLFAQVYTNCANKNGTLNPCNFSFFVSVCGKHS